MGYAMRALGEHAPDGTWHGIAGALADGQPTYVIYQGVDAPVTIILDLDVIRHEVEQAAAIEDVANQR
jgi:hypothetical protein